MFEYKITYRRLGDMLTNCHYYMASDASEALEYQLEMIDHKGWKIEILKIEKFCRYAKEWINESDVLIQARIDKDKKKS
jgi:hypothetical protein